MPSKSRHSQPRLAHSEERQAHALEPYTEVLDSSCFMDALIADRGSIHCDNLTLMYDKHLAVDQLTGVFAPGSMTAIIGPNGGGKSTLLKTFAGYIPVNSGSLMLGARSLNDVAYLPQHHDNDRSFPLSVGDVVTMGLCPQRGFYRAFGASDVERIESALNDVGLEGFFERPLTALSGGQWQRVLFARMCLQHASIILLDEPFAAIDTSTMEDLAHILLRWSQEGRTIVAVLHDLDIVRDVFPTTLILARHAIAWGVTQDVLTLEHMRTAKAIARSWGAAPLSSSSPYEGAPRPDV